MLIDTLYRQAHVYFTIPESLQDAGILKRLMAILSEEELDRYQRYHFPADQHRHLISHALVRRTLSTYVDIAAEEWYFSRGEHGRPEIANPGVPPLRFNLTHTAGLVCCIVTLDDACGIDAERINSQRATSGISRKMFSETEHRQLERLTGRQRLEHFFTCWTLREAYVKATGVGIFYPTRKLTFAVDTDKVVGVSFHPDIADQGNKWHFQLFTPTTDHIAAIAVRRTSDNEKSVVTRFVNF